MSRKTILHNQPSIILNNIKYSNPPNKNWSPNSRRLVYLNRVNPKNNTFHILHIKPNNNKTMRQNNKLKVKKLQTKPNVLKTL